MITATLLASTACGGEGQPATAPEPVPTTTAVAGPAPHAPPPAPEVLTEVLYQLADVAVPGDRKVGLVEGATPDSAAQLDRFGKALVDSAYTPVGFTAENIAWSPGAPGNVTADVTVRSENPELDDGFTFPMEFTQTPSGWQLSKRTADILLTFGQNQAPAPTG